MPERFDVVVVGARCAGSPLAALLARRGLRVAVLERATFPRDTLSTHIFQAQPLAFLERLGVTEKVHATGAPVVGLVDLRLEDFGFQAPLPQRTGDVGGIRSVRRSVLDPILAEAALDAGAEVRMGAKVSGLEKDGARVTGVRVVHDGSESILQTRLVVGADGRNSTVASGVGARKYNLTPNERFAYWSFFEGAELGADPAFVLHRWGERFVIAVPADSGLYQVVVMPKLSELPRYREDLEGNFIEHARSCPPVAEALSGARRVGKIFGMLRWQGFFREASGAGWVLVGDAGHFKDPAAGQGIGDAFRQGEALVPAIVRGLEGSDQVLDRALADWGRWRDWDAIGHYWLATDIGKGGRVPTALPEVGKRLLARGELGPLIDLFSHRGRPAQVFTPPRLLAAMGRVLARPGCDRRALVGEIRALAAENARRQRVYMRPEFEVRPEFETADVVIAGVRSPILHAGPSDASEAVVFVHGNPGQGDDWSELMGRVGEFARALAPDMPGYGSADKPRDFNYTIDGYAEHLDGLLAELGVRRVHLVAHDFGGPSALAWAAKHPDAFASATLIGTGALIDYQWHRYAKIWRTPIAGELFQATASRAGFRFLLGRENRRLYPEAVDRLYAISRPWATRRTVVKLYRATPAEMMGASKEALRALDRPALVLWGSADVYFPCEQAERQRQAIPSARVELLEGLGHWPFLEDPGRVAALVVPFLREQLGADIAGRA